MNFKKTQHRATARARLSVEALEAREVPAAIGGPDQYLVGDWNGDGRDELAFRCGNQIYYEARFGDTLASAHFGFGNGNSENQYLVGDFNGDGRDELAVRRGNQIYYEAHFGDVTAVSHFGYGNGSSEDQYLVGDWNGDGRDELAVRRGNQIYYEGHLGDGAAAGHFGYGNGNSENQYLVGDWNGDGRDELAVRRGNQIYYEGHLGDGAAAGHFGYGNGNSEDQYPVGDWNGNRQDELAVRRGNQIFYEAHFGDGSATGNFNFYTTIDHPASSNNYVPVSGNLFGPGGPSYLDVEQGTLGDCWLLASLAETAVRDPSDIISMFTKNGSAMENGVSVDLYTVRLYDTQRIARYITVDTELPTGVEHDLPINGVLWVALAEKAYAQANGAGLVSTNQMYTDSYEALQGGPPDAAGNVKGGKSQWALAAITGNPASSFDIKPSDVASAWMQGQLVVLASDAVAPSPYIVNNHSYAVLSYNASSSLPFKVFNPWGTDTTGWSLAQDAKRGMSTGGLTPTLPFYPRTSARNFLEAVKHPR